MPKASKKQPISFIGLSTILTMLSQKPRARKQTRQGAADLLSWCHEKPARFRPCH